MLGVYGLHSFQYLFVTPYASACLITGLFIANGAIFSIYLLKYTSGRILYVVPSLAILILVILISFSFEMENVETLSEANWDDVRSIWIWQLRIVKHPHNWIKCKLTESAAL